MIMIHLQSIFDVGVLYVTLDGLIDGLPKGGEEVDKCTWRGGDRKKACGGEVHMQCPSKTKTLYLLNSPISFVNLE